MALSHEERLQLATIDPELSEILRHANIPDIDTSDPAKAIANLRWYMKSRYAPPKPEDKVIERDVDYAARDGFQLRGHVYEPAERSKDPPALVVYIHGGGWTIGSPEDTAASCRRLVQDLGVICIAPSYRQGPEDPFPAGINDAWDSMQWIASHAETQLGVSLSRGFVLGGSSAGGSMAAVISHLARDEKLVPALSGVFLLAPMILPPEAARDALPEKYRAMYLSRTQPECQKDPVLSPELEKIFHDAANADLQSPLHVSYIWPTGHQDLPRTYFQVCGMDILRDEDLIYEQTLCEDYGVETKMDVYPGVPHIFWGIFPSLSQSKAAAEHLSDGITWLLRRE